MDKNNHLHFGGENFTEIIEEVNGKVTEAVQYSRFNWDTKQKQSYWRTDWETDTDLVKTECIFNLDIVTDKQR